MVHLDQGTAIHRRQVLPDDLHRQAMEWGDFTCVFWRTNPLGSKVRDAKFYPNAGTADMAARMFADEFATVETGLCAVLRGQVKTVDHHIDLADTAPWMDGWAGVIETYKQGAADGQATSRYTVYASYDTGDGHRRYLSYIVAIDAFHAELTVAQVMVTDYPGAVFLTAGVVEGWKGDEQVDAVWATPDGTRERQQPATPTPASQPWYRRVVDGLRAKARRQR